MERNAGESAAGRYSKAAHEPGIEVIVKNYKELYLAGEIEFEEIDDYSYEWGMSEDERTLAQYLGLNEEEEDAWISVGEDALRELLDKQKR